ncbi:hypothetical protein SDC9_143625 [bioreactor metagenome]|uniref:Uncharacterized protein n=1 Tax=bioreactor metagenome TaxID=1076179 RepID=A0A645E796_9ZZZZ
MPGPPTVERPLAMCGVADDGVRHMLQVAADLVPASGERLGMHQRGARVFKAWVAGDGQLQPGDAAQAGASVLHGCVGRGVIRAQRVVHVAMPWRPAAHQGQVFLVHLMRQKRLRQCPFGAWVQAHHQHAAGALVEPVHRIDMPPQLVAHGLHHKARLARIQPGSVHQPASGLVHRHHMFVVPDQIKRRQRGAAGVEGHGRIRKNWPTIF